MEKNKKMKGVTQEVGYPEGGKQVPTPKAGQVIQETVQGQGAVLAEKKRTAKII